MDTRTYALLLFLNVLLIYLSANVFDMEPKFLTNLSQESYQPMNKIKTQYHTYHLNSFPLNQKKLTELYVLSTSLIVEERCFKAVGV